MKAQLMSALGVSEGLATQAIATFDAGILQRLLALAENLAAQFANNPLVKDAVTAGVRAALPFLLKGDNLGALEAFATAFLAVIVTPPPAPAPVPEPPSKTPAVASPEVPDNTEQGTDPAPLKKKR